MGKALYRDLENADGTAMSNAKIQQALGNLFDKQRIVFWYDTRREFRADFEALSLPGVEKIELANNDTFNSIPPFLQTTGRLPSA